jgi:glycyl-tRNA synthetase
MAKQAPSEFRVGTLMEKIVSLCKRRGIIFPSSEVYGGLNGCWDYGPLGVELKRNIKEAWWQATVNEREDVVGLDASILMNPAVWKASGHVDEFTDPMVDCKECKHRFKADNLEGDRCPDCGGELTEARRFNLMFRTFIGPVEEDAAVVYLRPETAQGIFVNFDNVLNTARTKVPFGIAQIGKAFRNEINPRNFTFRSREFEQMELEFFVAPGEDERWYDFWRDQRYNWYLGLGIRKENLRLRDHEKDELAHYAKACVDVEYNFPFGWSELEGVANRTDYDLTCHTKESGKKLDYFDENRKERFTPFVIEPSAGVDRSTLAFIVDAYAEEEERTVLRFHPRIAPIKVGVFPLLRKDGQPEKAIEIRDRLKRHFSVIYDHAGAIGRRYRRQDEVGTPFCVTVDHQTFDDNTVTLRERDSMEQVRVPSDSLVSILRERIYGE